MLALVELMRKDFRLLLTLLLQELNVCVTSRLSYSKLLVLLPYLKWLSFSVMSTVSHPCCKNSCLHNIINNSEHLTNFELFIFVHSEISCASVVIWKNQHESRRSHNCKYILSSVQLMEWLPTWSTSLLISSQRKVYLSVSSHSVALSSRVLMSSWT